MKKGLVIPDNFKLGAALSAWQVEGHYGKKPHQDSYLDLWYRKDRQAWYREQGPDAATDFYRRYKEDIALMQSINLQCFRTSLNWSRFLLDYENIVVDEEYAAYFDDMLDTCLAAGVGLMS